MNSTHQLWSAWTITVEPSRLVVPDTDTVRANVARFLRKLFGSVAQCRVRRSLSSWVIEARVECQRHPHDQTDFDATSRHLTRFLRNGFGEASEVRVSARLLSGVRLDGAPPDQCVMMPAINLLAEG